MANILLKVQGFVCRQSVEKFSAELIQLIKAWLWRVSAYFTFCFLTIQKPHENPLQKSLGAGDQLIRNANLQFRLAQAKDVAIKQLEVTNCWWNIWTFHERIFQLERKQQSLSTMSGFISKTLKQVNRESPKQKTPITLFTLQILRTMNVTQLQIVINEIYDFRGVLNEMLVKNLVERDELLSKRDVMLGIIEKNCKQQKRLPKMKETPDQNVLL